MNITVKKRTRIAEIIVGIVLICFSLLSFRSFWLIYFPDMSYFKLRITPYLLIPILSTLFRILLAVMLIFRLYHCLPVKILYCITAPGLLLNSIGGSILLGYLFEPYSVFTASGSYYENHDLLMLTDILMFLLVLAAAVIAFLTMNRNIVWKSRKHLLIYTYAITGLYMAMSLMRLQADYFALLLFMLPCLMQDYTVNKNTKGITGCAAFALKPVLPVAIGYFYAHYYDGMVSGFSYITTGKSNISSNGSEQYILFMTCLNILLVLLAPLMLFERKCTEAEDVAQVKKLSSDDEDEDDDDEDDDEYEEDDDEDEEGDDESDHND